MGRWSDDNDKPKTVAAGDTIIKTIENVCECICDNYCKYREQSWNDSDELSEICKSCPLNLLQ